LFWGCGVSNFDKIVGFLGSATFIGALLYWTGRWYKQSYFDVFNIPFETIGFDHYYYIYHSWCTVLVAIAGLGILFFILMISNSFIKITKRILRKLKLKIIGKLQGESSPFNYKKENNQNFIFFTFLITLLTICGLLSFLFFSPEEYETDFQIFDKIINKLLISMDIIIILLGIFSIVFLTIFLKKIKFNLSEKIKKYKDEYQPYNFPAILSICLVIWLYFATIGYSLGQYHANSAIKKEKMQLPHIKLNNSKPGEEWFYIAKASNTHNYIYEKNSKKTMCVKDEEIIEMK
jgi:MFS family permease